jgi:integrase
VVADMARLQLLAGMRPGEVIMMRPCDLTMRTDGAWVYRPESHKTEHHGRERRIFIGPEAQTILRPYLDRQPMAFCFSPSESVDQIHAERRAKRKSPLTPSQRARQRKPAPRRAPSSTGYTSASYRRSIERACEAAFGMPAELRNIDRQLPPEDVDRLRQQAAEWRDRHAWHPNQLRHARATVIREKFGLEAAQVVLGHSDPRVTQIYAERNFTLAANVMQQIG